MADDRKIVSRHQIIMDRRENISITGVVEVISFDEETICCETEMGILIIKGSNLHVNKLNLDDGELAIDGDIENLGYEDNMMYSKGGSSFLSKIFR